MNVKTKSVLYKDRHRVGVMYKYWIKKRTAPFNGCCPLFCYRSCTLSMKVVYILGCRILTASTSSSISFHALSAFLDSQKIASISAESITKKPPSHNQVQGRFSYNFSLFFHSLNPAIEHLAILPNTDFALYSKVRFGFSKQQRTARKYLAIVLCRCT